MQKSENCYGEFQTFTLFGYNELIKNDCKEYRKLACLFSGDMVAEQAGSIRVANIGPQKISKRI